MKQSKKQEKTVKINHDSDIEPEEVKVKGGRMGKQYILAE